MGFQPVRTDWKPILRGSSRPLRKLSGSVTFKYTNEDGSAVVVRSFCKPSLPAR